MATLISASRVRNSIGNLGDGGRYNPATNPWTLVTDSGAPAKRILHKAVWTGREMIVWGGRKADGTYPNGTFTYTVGRMYLYMRP